VHPPRERPIAWSSAPLQPAAQRCALAWVESSNSVARATPRVSVGSSGDRRANCLSLSQNRSAISGSLSGDRSITRATVPLYGS
jgi:hypothetical protein